MGKAIRFESPSGEVLIHKERPNGIKELLIKGCNKDGHAVMYENGNLIYLREPDGRVIADDKYEGG